MSEVTIKPKARAKRPVTPFLDREWGKYYGVEQVPGEFGVEIEVEGLFLPKQVTGWQRKIETSLRGRDGRVISPDDDLEDTPAEYVTRGPMTYKNLEAALGELKRRLTGEKVEIHLTDRASTHVHMNFSCARLKDIFGFVVAYCIVEPVLMRLCGHKRNGNLFCLPTYDTGDLPLTFREIIEHVDSGMPRYWQTRGKYSALNLDPLTNLGSIEFRGFPNSVSPEEILRWCRWLRNIRNAGAGRDDLRRLLDEGFDTPQLFLNKVFDGAGLLLPCQPHNPSELLEQGLENAYECYKAVKPAYEHADFGSGKRYPRKSKFTLSLDDWAIASSSPPPMPAELLTEEPMED